MNNKIYFLVIATIIVITLLLGGLYLSFIVHGIENQFESKNDAQIILESIEKTDNIEKLKEVTFYAVQNNIEATKRQFDYFRSFTHILFILSFINLVFLCVLHKKYNNDSNKALKDDAAERRGAF